VSIIGKLKHKVEMALLEDQASEERLCRATRLRALVADAMCTSSVEWYLGSERATVSDVANAFRAEREWPFTRCSLRVVTEGGGMASVHTTLGELVKELERA